MAWPPGVLPINRQNLTPQNGTHPADHNAVNQAVNDTVAQIGVIEAGIGSEVARLDGRIDDVKADSDNNTAAIDALETRVGVSGNANPAGIGSGAVITVGGFAPSYTPGMPVMETDPVSLQANAVFRLPAYESIWAMQVFLVGQVATQACDAWIELIGFGNLAITTLPIGKSSFSVATCQPLPSGSGLKIGFYNGNPAAYTTAVTANLFKVGP